MRHSHSHRHLLMKAEVIEATTHVEQILSKERGGLKSLLREKVHPMTEVPIGPIQPRALVESFSVANRLAHPMNSYHQGYPGQQGGPLGTQNFGHPHVPYQPRGPSNPPRQQYQGFQGNQGIRPPRDRSTITCYGCGQVGHFRSECPMMAGHGQGQYNPPGVNGQGPNPNQDQYGGFYSPLGQSGPPGFQGPGTGRIQEIPNDGNSQTPAQVAAVDIVSSAFDGIAVRIDTEDCLSDLVREVRDYSPREAMACERVRFRSPLTSSGSGGEGPS